MTDIKSKKRKSIDADSMLWGILEDKDAGIVALKLIMEWDSTDNDDNATTWTYPLNRANVKITDLTALLTLQKAVEDTIRLIEHGEDANVLDLEQLLSQLEPSIKNAIDSLQDYKKEGKLLEEAILDLCKLWNLTRAQSELVLSLIIATVKLTQEELVSAIENKQSGDFSGYV